MLWNHNGRPVAAATIYPRAGNLCHEFASLSRGSTLVARDGDHVVWTPKSAGADFRDLPDAPVSSKSPAVRLRQMKSLAGRFAATLTGVNADGSDREELRLLPTPVYRYKLDVDPASSPDLQDGAVFAFAQGTDPEVLPLLELVQSDEGPHWQHPFARATAGGLEARLGDMVVWEADRFPDDRDATQPTITLRRAALPACQR